jgi:hypothetical protein
VETNILDVAQCLMSGLEHNTAHFPSPPFPPSKLGLLLQTVQRNTEDSGQAIEALSVAIKEDFQYAKTVVGMDYAKLRLLGWMPLNDEKAGAEKAGEVVGLKVAGHGPGWVKLSWVKPEDGGSVIVYRVMRRMVGERCWTLAGEVKESEIVLRGQLKAIVLEYQVVAMNELGEGVPSNVVMTVL